MLGCKVSQTSELIYREQAYLIQLHSSEDITAVILKDIQVRNQ